MSDRYVDWYGKARRQNWRTPRVLFNKLNERWHFTMDGASELDNALLPKASTVEYPLSWDSERVFCNPPWSNIRPFLDLSKTAECAVFLVPARTNSRWFHHALALGAQPVYFLGKPRFEGAPFNSPVDCLLLVFGGKNG